MEGDKQDDYSGDKGGRRFAKADLVPVLPQRSTMEDDVEGNAPNEGREWWQGWYARQNGRNNASLDDSHNIDFSSEPVYLGHNYRGRMGHRLPRRLITSQYSVNEELDADWSENEFMSAEMNIYPADVQVTVSRGIQNLPGSESPAVSISGVSEGRSRSEPSNPVGVGIREDQSVGEPSAVGDDDAMDVDIGERGRKRYGEYEALGSAKQARYGEDESLGSAIIQANVTESETSGDKGAIGLGGDNRLTIRSFFNKFPPGALLRPPAEGLEGEAALQGEHPQQ